MDREHVAILRHGDELYVYGPLSAGEADDFAEFMRYEVDPVRICQLRSPLSEALSWRKAEIARNNAGEA